LIKFTYLPIELQIISLILIEENDGQDKK